MNIYKNSYDDNLIDKLKINNIYKVTTIYGAGTDGGQASFIGKLIDIEKSYPRYHDRLYFKIISESGNLFVVQKYKNYKDFGECYMWLVCDDDSTFEELIDSEEESQ